MFEDIKKAQLVEKIRVMAATGQTGEEIKKSLSKDELTLMKSFNNDIEKGKAAQIGEVRVWNGKKMRKQANGKWVEVSESGKNKKEHAEEAQKHYKELYGQDKSGISDIKHHNIVDYHLNENKKHYEQALKLSDKEYDESELSGDDLVDKVANHYNVSREKVSKLKLDGTDTPLELSRALGLHLNDTSFEGVKGTIKKLSENVERGIKFSDIKVGDELIYNAKIDGVNYPVKIKVLNKIGDYFNARVNEPYPKYNPGLIRIDSTNMNNFIESVEKNVEGKVTEDKNKLTLREKLESNNPIEGVEKWVEGINEFKKIDGVVYKFDEGEGEFRKYEQQNQKRSKQTPYYD